jgi:cleavage and polyadenylation specificity factor subunit 5
MNHILTQTRWRPNHETFLYPFLPAHSTRPKELKKLYLIHLPPTKILSVPKNMKLLAVPLFELYDNTARYGPQLSAIPHYLSRYRFEFVDDQGRVSKIMPGGGGLLGGGGGIRLLSPDKDVKVEEAVEGLKSEDDLDMGGLKTEEDETDGLGALKKEEGK